MKPTEIISRLLGNIGSRKEVEQYLRHYASVEAPKFAVVKVSGSVVEGALDDLASSLAFLNHVGLVPIVVHGGGVQLEAAVAKAGLDVPRVDGLVPMTPEVLELARRVLHETNHVIVEAIEALGTRARPFTSGVFEVVTHDDPDLGLVGDVKKVTTERIERAVASGFLPVVTPLGETATGQIAVLHADDVAHELAAALRPHKVVYLDAAGGLVDVDGRLRPAVNLAEDGDSLLAPGILSPAARRKLQSIKELLEDLPPTSSVSITSPDHLARELFTHRGAGTLVRRGERVQVYGSFEDVDVPRLRALLEECFARKLDPSYFVRKVPYRVYLSESYRATAILTLEDGVPYLDKFAVTPEAQGEGIGASIWQRLRFENPKVFWRARAKNPINGWYAQNADGLYKSDPFWVFWCGMESWAEIEACVTCALAMPATLKDAHPHEEPTS